MKKIILLVVSLVFVATLFAGASGEAYMQYPLIGYAGAADEDGGLVQGYVGIGYWGADYGFHFNFRDTAWPGDNFTINHMFKKFTLHPMVNLLVGKTAVPFVKQNNPSGFANINIVETIVNPMFFNNGNWTFINPRNDFMLKFDGNVSGLGWQLYTANVNLSNVGLWDYADYGLRLDYNVAGVDIGAGLMMVGVPEDADGMMNWAFDLGYTAVEMIKLDLQLVNNQYVDGDGEVADDMNLHFVTYYVPGIKEIKPYLGYYTYAEMEENVMFFGLNFAPTKDSILKLEYKMFSQEVLDGLADDDDYLADTLTLQLGFSF
jgi:hypothetical protein